MSDDVSSSSPQPKRSKSSPPLLVTLLCVALLFMGTFGCVLPIGLIAVQSMRESMARERAKRTLDQLRAGLEAYEDRQRESLPAADR